MSSSSVCHLQALPLPGLELLYSRFFEGACRNCPFRQLGFGGLIAAQAEVKEEGGRSGKGPAGRGRGEGSSRAAEGAVTSCPDGGAEG